MTTRTPSANVADPASRRQATLPECFVVMPISDPEGYGAGHFQRVFEDVFRPACRKAGYEAVRASDVRETNLIHLDVLQKLLNSPMVLVDLSSRNPNVLFELGLRQAFDKPVVLVQEVGTPRIFDIAPLRYTEYHRERIYHEVLHDQEEIAKAIEATRDAYSRGAGVNSIVRILALTQPAALEDVQEANRDPVLQLIRAELSDLRTEIRRSQQHSLLARSPRVRAPQSPSAFSDLALIASMVPHLEDQLRHAREAEQPDPNLLARIQDFRRFIDTFSTASDPSPDVIYPGFIDLCGRLASLEAECLALHDAHEATPAVRKAAVTPALRGRQEVSA